MDSTNHDRNVKPGNGIVTSKLLQVPSGCATPLQTPSGCATPINSTGYTTDIEKALKGEQQLPCCEPTVHFHHPITTQRDHFLASIGESLSVGLGLGSAIGIWACIHDTLKKATYGNVHIANWVCGPILGFLLAPLLEKAARVFFGKAGSVLATPKIHNTAGRFIDHFTTISTALVGLGICKGIQMQYGPLHSNVGLEYAVFVVGFGFHAFLRVVLYTLITGHEYEVERIECSWRRVPEVIFWDFIDHFHHIYIVVTVNIRDSLTFCLYPYLMVLWIGYWGTVDPEGHHVWLPQMLNIGFFFSFFSILKEVTYLLGKKLWTEDLPVHRHHGL